MKNIYVDFDGVIHSYKTRFTTVTNIPDPPVDGAIAWLEELTKHAKVTIFTTRMLQGIAQQAIIEWLFNNGLSISTIEKLSFSCIKGGADVYIDDRAFKFEGTFPTFEELYNFKTWNQTPRL